MKMKDLSKFAVVLPIAFLTANPSPSMARPLGIDVSDYQGAINWGDVYASGVTFAFAKATEGNYEQDTQYKNNMVDGKSAGLQMGAYHYARPDIDCPSDEATYFWNYAGGQIKADGKSIYPLVFFEIANGHSCTASYTAWFNQWAADVKAKDSVFLHPVIGVTPCGTACGLTTNISLSAFIINPGSGSGSPWTVCDCCNAWDPCGTGGWSYWSYGSGIIGGISGDVDLDTYNGTLAELKEYQGVGN
jgi:lysozyme